MNVSRKHSIALKLLRTLAMTGALAVSLTSPYGASKFINSALRAYVRKQRLDKRRFLQDIRRLQQRKLLSYHADSSGNIEIKITENGRKKVLEYNVDLLELKIPKRWNRTWHLVLFDIPNSQRKARDQFRRKLKDLKFYSLQRSVFITPYPCENEIRFLATILKIENHILILPLAHFEGEEKLRYLFNL